MREAERGEKRKRRASVQSISSQTSNGSTDSGSSSDCEVEKVVVKKKSAKLAAIFLGKKEVQFLSPSLFANVDFVERDCERRPCCDSSEEGFPDELGARGVEEQGVGGEGEGAGGGRGGGSSCCFLSN